tara:strand:- start:901 stop:1200 length:300 start_codon:yes stop_codon:yes gene_type:complete
MDDLAAKMKAAGMLPIDEILAGNLMGKFSTHVAVVDLPSLKWWVESQHEKYLRMRLEYEVGGKEKDDMWEWVFAHSAVFGTIADHMRKALPSVESGETN